MKKTVLSGIQTTGNLHLGNYLGAIHNWLDMQEDYNCYFFLADLHSITVDRAPEELRQSILSSVSTYLACGIDPKKSSIFLQSDVPEHAQLAWILNCITPLGWLKRMTQFKDKAGKKQDNANTGLFTYPILMAADILLYNSDLVPVGEDQKQHLELTRDIAGVINRKFNKEVLKMPEPLIQGNSTRIMSLRDGKQKMSKSDPSDASRINLNDTPDIITQKIKRAKTDSITEISYDLTSRPEISNLINIYSSLANLTVENIVDNYQNKGFSEFKNDLAELIIEKIRPINQEYQKIIQDQNYIKQVLKSGADKAKIIAQKTYTDLVDQFGLKI